MGQSSLMRAHDVLRDTHTPQPASVCRQMLDGIVPCCTTPITCIIMYGVVQGQQKGTGWGMGI